MLYWLAFRRTDAIWFVLLRALFQYTFNKNEGSTEFQPFIMSNGYKAYNNDRCYELQEGQGFGLGFMV